MAIIPLDQLEQQSNVIPLDQLEQQISGSGFRDIPPERINKSPISIMERLKLSFADDLGRENYLNKKFRFVQRLPNGKFAAGNNAQDIRPIDPEGIFNDVLGDLADVAGEVPVIAGQILGATKGTLVAPVAGTIAGGALGAAAGETARIGIGQALGVRESKAIEEAVDIAIVGAFGAGGEILGQGLKFGGRGLSKLAKAKLTKAVKTSTNPSKMLHALGKVFKITAAVDPDDVVVAGMYGFDDALSDKYMNREFGRELMTKFTKGLIIRNKALGKMVGQGDDWAIKNFGKKLVPIEQAGDDLIKLLSNPRVGLVDDLGRVNRRAFTETADYRAIKNLTDEFFAKSFRNKSLVPRKMTVRQIIDAKKKAKPLLNKYFKSSGKNPIAERGIARYLDEITGLTGQQTLPKGVTSITDDVIKNNPYLKANKSFSQWKKNVDLLKVNGLDVTDVNDLSKLIRKGKVVSQKMERFFEGFKIKNSSAQEAFSIIADELPVKFHGKGLNGTIGTLADELKKYNAAQGFANANPNFLRLGAVSGLVGINLGRDDPAEAVLSGGLGLLLATPAGARILLRTPSKLKMATKGAEKVLQRRIDRRIATSTLSTLLRQADKERKRKKSATRSKLIK